MFCMYLALESIFCRISFHNKHTQLEAVWICSIPESSNYYIKIHNLS